MCVQGNAWIPGWLVIMEEVGTRNSQLAFSRGRDREAGSARHDHNIRVCRSCRALVDAALHVSGIHSNQAGAWLLQAILEAGSGGGLGATAWWHVISPPWPGSAPIDGSTHWAISGLATIDNSIRRTCKHDTDFCRSKIENGWLGVQAGRKRDPTRRGQTIAARAAR